MAAGGMSEAMSANEDGRLPVGYVRRTMPRYRFRYVQRLLLREEESEGHERSGTYGWVPVQPGGHA